MLGNHEIEFKTDESLDASAVPNYTKPIVLRRGFEVTDAACAIKRFDPLQDKDEANVEFNSIVNALVSEYQVDLPDSLLTLAKIMPFKLFISATPDNLLATAINKIRHNEANITYEIEYAPKLSSGSNRDLPDDWDQSRTRYSICLEKHRRLNQKQYTKKICWNGYTVYNVHGIPDRLIYYSRFETNTFFLLDVRSMTGWEGF